MYLCTIEYILHTYYLYKYNTYTIPIYVGTYKPADEQAMDRGAPGSRSTTLLTGSGYLGTAVML